MAATAQSAANEPAPKHLSEAVKRFCRSIELCDDYLRGYYGLKLVSRSSKTQTHVPLGRRQGKEGVKNDGLQILTTPCR